MSKKLSPLNQLNIPKPCNADWDEMRGNNFMRFCEHCNLNVNDISALTHKEAVKLILKSKARLCVRYVRRPDGAIQTASRELFQITRRASRVAAGVFTAALSLSSVAIAKLPSNISSTEFKQGITISEAMKTKMRAGANINIRNKEGKTALAIALEENLPKIIRSLESYGAKQ